MIRVRLSGGLELNFEADMAETDGDWLTLKKYEDYQEDRKNILGTPHSGSGQWVNIVAQFRDVAVDGWWQVDAKATDPVPAEEAEADGV